MNKPAVKHTIYLFLFLLLACSGENEKEEGIRLEFPEPGGAFPEEWFDFTFIPLETTDESLISSINKIKIFEDRIYIIDIRGKDLLVFDINGKFIDRVGKQGDGPMEYGVIMDFTIEPQKRIVLVYDVEKNRLLSFDIDTYKSLSYIPVPHYHSSFEVLPDGNFGWFNHYGTHESKGRQYFLMTDSLMNPLENHYDLFFKPPVSFSTHDNFVYIMDNRTFIYNPLTLTIYEITPEGMFPHIDINFKKHTSPPIDFLQSFTKELSGYLDRLEKCEYISTYGIQETKELVWIDYSINRKFYTALYDKINQRKCINEIFDFFWKSSLNVLLFPKGVYEDYIISSIHVPDIMNLKETSHPGLIKIIEDITEESNPIICLLKLKTP